MSTATSERGIPQKHDSLVHRFTMKARDLVRGYSDQDLSRATDLLNGLVKITDEDRQDYRNLRKKRKSQLLFLNASLTPGSYGAFDPIQLDITPDQLLALREEMNKIDEIPDEEINTGIRSEAEQLLEKAKSKKDKHAPTPIFP